MRNTIGGKECLAAGRQQLPRCSSRQRRSRTTCRVGTAVASFKPLHRWFAKPAQCSSAVKTARLTVTTVSHSRCHAPLCESSRWKATARVVVTMASTSDGASSLSHDNASVCLLVKAVAVTKESSNMLWALSRDDLSTQHHKRDGSRKLATATPRYTFPIWLRSLQWLGTACLGMALRFPLGSLNGCQQLPVTFAMPLATFASRFRWEAGLGFVALEVRRRAFQTLGNPVFKLAGRGFIVPAWLWQSAASS